MGYLCPVCEEPFGDQRQCGNHLAVTAILHREAHEQWLADAVATDDWESISRTELAEIVAERATETTDHDHPGDHTHPVGHEQSSQTQSTGGAGLPEQADQPAITESTGELDADAQAVLREARELTERMQQRGPSGGDGTDGSDGSDSGADDSADETKES